MSDIAGLTLHDFDLCSCGDYRHQHVNGVGRCKMPDDLTHGFRACLKFRLAREAVEIPVAYRQDARKTK